MSEDLINKGKPYETEEYLPLNENYYDILSDCKSLLSEQAMDNIRIIFKEIVDINSIKRDIYINGVIDIPNKISYLQFLNKFTDYISELDSFFNLSSLYQEHNNIGIGQENQKKIFDKVYYVGSTKRQNIYDINGNIIFFENLLNQEEFEQKLKVLIFWNDIDDIESKIKKCLDIAKNYILNINFIFISNIDNFIQKKSYLLENNYYRVLDENTKLIKSNIYYIFDDKFLHSKYYLVKYPWYVILNKNNDIFDSGILHLENIQNKIDNFLSQNPESKQNINNLFWIDLSNKIKLNTVRKINLELTKNNYNNIHFYIETNTSIANQELLSSFDIDAYFFGKLESGNIEKFKEFAENICKEQKIKNIFYNIEN